MIRGTPVGSATEDDVVALLMRQHEQIRSLFTEVEAAAGSKRREAFSRLVRLLAVHETAEEEVVHPYARRAVEDGEQIVAARLEEERRAKEKLSQLEDMDPDSPQFTASLVGLQADVFQHAKSEEQYEFSRLRETVDADRRRNMARAVKAAEAMAPTHPHPGMESAAKNLLLGPVAALVDRTRDAVRKAMGGKD